MQNVTPIKWNNTIFNNLVINPQRKILIRSFAESHTGQNSIDEFVEGV